MPFFHVTDRKMAAKLPFSMSRSMFYLKTAMKTEIVATATASDATATASDDA